MIIMVTRPADVCLPFTVKVGDGVGRYVVATRDIKAGQVILTIMMMAMIKIARMMMTIVTNIVMVMMIITRMMVQVSEGVGRYFVWSGWFDSDENYDNGDSLMMAFGIHLGQHTFKSAIEYHQSV